MFAIRINKQSPYGVNGFKMLLLGNRTVDAVLHEEVGVGDRRD